MATKRLEKTSNVGDCDVEDISDDTACWCLCCVKSVIWFAWDFEIVKQDKNEQPFVLCMCVYFIIIELGIMAKNGKSIFQTSREAEKQLQNES